MLKCFLFVGGNYKQLSKKERTVQMLSSSNLRWVLHVCHFCAVTWNYPDPCNLFMLCKNSMRYSGYEKNSSYSPKIKPHKLSLLIVFVTGTTSYWEHIFNRRNHRFRLDNTAVKYLGLAIKLRTRSCDYTDTLAQLWTLHLPPDQMLQFS